MGEMAWQAFARKKRKFSSFQTSGVLAFWGGIVPRFGPLPLNVEMAEEMAQQAISR